MKTETVSENKSHKRAISFQRPENKLIKTNLTHKKSKRRNELFDINKIENKSEK